EDRELFASEPRGDVVLAKLALEDLSDALKHGIAGQVTVGVVHVAKQVEVGHDQRQRALEPRRARELLGERRCEVPRIEEARLRVDSRLLLELRDRERPMDQEERRDRE